MKALSGCPAAKTASDLRGRTVEIFQALGSEARLCLVRELDRAGDKCVCDLVGCCGLGWSTVSHHLAVLREAGIVVDERRGRQIFYRLAMPCVGEFIRCLEEEGCRSLSARERLAEWS